MVKVFGQVSIFIHNFQTPMPIMFILAMVYTYLISFSWCPPTFGQGQGQFELMSKKYYMVKVFGQVTIFNYNFQTPMPIMFILGIHKPYTMLMMSTNLGVSISKVKATITYIEIVHG